MMRDKVIVYGLGEEYKQQRFFIDNECDIVAYLNRKSDIIVWGAGEYSGYLLDFLAEFGKENYVSCIVDADEHKIGKLFHGKQIKAPDTIRNMKFGLIIIAVSDWFPIYKRLVREFEIASELIDNIYFYQRYLFLQHYMGLSGLDNEQLQMVNRIKEFPLNHAFNFDGMDSVTDDIDIFFDEEHELYYAIYEGKRMYMSRKFDSRKKVARYVLGLLVEQNENSPHRYMDDSFKVEEGDIVLDAGVAEGIFSLSIIDKAAHIYLVEADKEWLEPLQLTFADYSDKITLIHAFLSDCTEGRSVRLDDIIRGELNFLKMDIEGSEPAALYGGKQTLAGRNVKIAVCAYHSPGEYGEVMQILKDYGYTANPRHGYMCLDLEHPTIDERIRKWQAPQLVRGVICAELGPCRV